MCFRGLRQIAPVVAPLFTSYSIYDHKHVRAWHRHLAWQGHDGRALMANIDAHNMCSSDPPPLLSFTCTTNSPSSPTVVCDGDGV